MRLEGIRQTAEAILAAELRVDAGVVHDVVTVDRARAGRVDRRRIEMADPELRQVRDDPHRIVEGEVLVELDPVGGSGRRCRKCTRPGLYPAAFLREGGRK